jgi:hypothetical protein
MSDSTNLRLPYLEGAQAQKHVTVNESLRRLDALVLLSVEDKDLSAPPGSPGDGARYIPKATASGLWSGKENAIAHYVDGAWEFYTPRAGFLAYVRDEDLFYLYNGADWVTFANALAFTALDVAGPVGVKSYTVAGVPSAAIAGRIIHVSDESGGAVLAFSDGSIWRRVTDRNPIS